MDITAPEGTKYEVRRGEGRDGYRFVEIWVGRVVVHRCVLCSDGMWR